MVFDPITFVAGDVNVISNTITLTNHNFNNGDKVIYKSSSPMTNLQHEGMYYVVVDTRNKIKLVKEEADVETQLIINIENASGGTICRINPLVEVTKNQKLKFDLSSTTLAFINNSTTILLLILISILIIIIALSSCLLKQIRHLKLLRVEL